MVSNGEIRKEMFLMDLRWLSSQKRGKYETWILCPVILTDKEDGIGEVVSDDIDEWMVGMEVALLVFSDDSC